MKVFLQSIVAQLLFTPYIYYRGRQALPSGKKWRIPYTLFFIAELLLYFTGFLFHKQLPDAVFIPLMDICNTWYVASIYLTLALLALEVVRLSDRWLGWYPSFVRSHWRQTKQGLMGVLIVSVAGLLIHGYQVVMNPVVTHVHITLPKGSGTRDSLTIAMMSDLHIGEVIGKPLVRKYVEMTNAQHPDMIVIVGDLMDYESRFAEKMQADEDLRQLHAPLGTYIVYGNHEYRANRDAKKRWIGKLGGTLLVDSVVMPDPSFYLIGRDDYINKRRKPLRTLMQGVDPTKPVILLDHQPWTFAEAAMNGIDLQLSGHTHNGQLWPYPLLMKLIFEQPYGYYRKGPTQFYVSSGIGIAGPPFRVGTVSELVILHIRFTNDLAR